MDQVVDINQRVPLSIAVAPNEKQAYHQQVAHQIQFDKERVAFGLQSSRGNEVEDRNQPVHANEKPFEENGALESIFTARISDLTNIIEHILADKKVKESAAIIQERSCDVASRRHQASTEPASQIPVAMPLKGLALNSAVLGLATLCNHQSSDSPNELMQFSYDKMGCRLSEPQDSIAGTGASVHRANGAGHGNSGKSDPQSICWW